MHGQPNIIIYEAGLCILLVSVMIFFCGAAAQRGPWPPHS
jgi:hypothetical protein